MKRLHLLCNAHLDPVWMWEWEEGAAETLSTFRTAADLCEKFGAFVFNHNEVILYEWVETYEPELFARIQRLVRDGRWHIMGGWFLQPDCNMSSGESLVRQALAGRTYFREKFGVAPTTAINFDPFGHSRGIVQILAKSGYDSYLFGRPDQNDCPLPDSDFIWVGYDGSEVAGHRFIAWYNSQLGKARGKIEKFMEDNAARETGLVLWGVGNHGGGPSHKDLEDLTALIAESKDVEIVHSTPERYFAEIAASGPPRGRHAADLNAWGVGCYTSQVRLKQKHRLLESALYGVEKTACIAGIGGGAAYPRAALADARHDLLTGEFHDILPGSSIQPVEEAALRLFDHGLELLSREQARLFFALASGQPRAKEGVIPIFAWNPHPWPVAGVFECEFNLPDANWEEQYTLPSVWRDGAPVPAQCEQPLGNINLDWRKRVVFRAELAPNAMNRFECTLERVLPARPQAEIAPENGVLRFDNGALAVDINCATGLADRFAVGGRGVLGKGAFLPLVMKDDADPWGMRYNGWREPVGQFTPLSPEKAAEIAGVAGTLDPVRVIEDGDARTVVEALLGYNDSFLALTYKLPKAGTEVEVQVRVYWNEKDRLLKLVMPSALASPAYAGQVAFGRDELPGADRECVAQQWTAVLSEADGLAFTCINEGSHGSDFMDGAMRLSLVRSPAYSGHPIWERPVTPQDRLTPRQDQGERLFRFWFNAGPLAERMDAVDREALARNQKPFVLSFFPTGAGTAPALPVVTLGDDVTVLSAFKEAEDGNGHILRIFEPTGRARETVVNLPPLGISQPVSLGAFEVKTFRLFPGAKALVETDMMENPL
ncbi:MAG TPA: glycoside hydrolase family 38 C-terminal domain-containing protein [Candidatus Hydrogenedentes bacterium]|nr:glycoside hydrolase family 38 C-terminal domain-containing protein [Candidatus Hydrogenedentota bacterium]